MTNTDGSGKRRLSRRLDTRSTFTIFGAILLALSSFPGAVVHGRSVRYHFSVIGAFERGSIQFARDGRFERRALQVELINDLHFGPVHLEGCDLGFYSLAAQRERHFGFPIAIVGLVERDDEVAARSRRATVAAFVRSRHAVGEECSGGYKKQDGCAHALNVSQ